MPLLTIVLVLLFLGVVLALINRYGKDYVDAKFIQLINIVVIVVAIIWLLRVFGVWKYLSTIVV